ncbi:MAG TPA: alpha/beta hydrolase [Nocardioidaceae bacterium]|nr:alpha/beta hydrolase [Nocardioidaceae bacterium]
MTIQFSHQRTSPAPVANPPQRCRSAGKTIAFSVVVGAMSALVLVLVVFAGGNEATITGALLLGFAFGWALIATLTVRRTLQPQRWALVPAGAMGATGAALVVFTPGNQALTTMSWVWPPLLLTLAVWMFVQVRRSVPGKARWILTMLTAVLALASIGATYDNIARIGDTDYAVPGNLYDVGGHRLHLDCRGHGSPTVVLSNSLGGVSAGWARIQGPVAATTRVCAYDRAGQGWSDEAERPRDGIESAEDLHTLLAAAGEHGPYVLVGHSTGGTYAMTYAARYPQQVAGLVLLDSSSPDQFTRMPAFAGQYAKMRRASALLPTLSRLGLGRLVPATSHLPTADAAKVTAITSGQQAYRNQRDEVSVIPEVFAQAQALTTLGDLPLAVLTASENSDGIEGWAGAQDELAALSVNHIHRTVDSTHTGLLEDTGPATESIRAIVEVITSARTGTPVGAHGQSQPIEPAPNPGRSA